MFIYGPPGVGKTTAVRLIASEANFQVREFNASDQRKKHDLMTQIPPILKNAALSFVQPACLVLEEVDGMSNKEDKDGLSTIGGILKEHEAKPRVPVVLVANEATKQLKSLAFNKKNVLVLQFTKLDGAAIHRRLATCFQQLGMPGDFQPVVEFITNSDGDFRKTINAHQFWLTKQVIEAGSDAALCKDIGKSLKADRDILTHEDAFKRLFRDDVSGMDELLRSDEFDPFLMRWYVHENLLPMLCVDAPTRTNMAAVPMAPDLISPIATMASHGDLFQARYLESLAGIFLTVVPTVLATKVWNWQKKKHPLRPGGNGVPTINQMLNQRQLYVRFPQTALGAAAKFRTLNESLRVLSRYLCDGGNAALDAREQIYLHRAELVRIFNDNEDKQFINTLNWMLEHRLTVDVMVMLLELAPPIGATDQVKAAWVVPKARIDAFQRTANNTRVTQAGLKRKREELAAAGKRVRPAATGTLPLPPPPSGLFDFARNAIPPPRPAPSAPLPAGYKGFFGAAARRDR